MYKKEEEGEVKYLTTSKRHTHTQNKTNLKKKIKMKISNDTTGGKKVGGGSEEELGREGSTFFFFSFQKKRRGLKKYTLTRTFPFFLHFTISERRTAQGSPKKKS